MRFDLLSIEYAAIVAAPKTHVDGRTFHLEWPGALACRVPGKLALGGTPVLKGDYYATEEAPDDLSF